MRPETRTADAGRPELLNALAQQGGHGLLYAAGSPGTGTPKTCSSSTALSASTTTVASVAAMVMSRLLTYGRATGDGKVLQFTLSDDAREPSQILKLTKEYLKSNKELKFKKLRIVAGGEIFEEDMDAEGEIPGRAHRPAG